MTSAASFPAESKHPAVKAGHDEVLLFVRETL